VSDTALKGRQAIIYEYRML